MRVSWYYYFIMLTESFSPLVLGKPPFTKMDDFLEKIKWPMTPHHNPHFLRIFWTFLETHWCWYILETFEVRLPLLLHLQTVIREAKKARGRGADMLEAEGKMWFEHHLFLFNFKHQIFNFEHKIFSFERQVFNFEHLILNFEHQIFNLFTLDSFWAKNNWATQGNRIGDRASLGMSYKFESPW